MRRKFYPAALMLAAFSTLFVACGKEGSADPDAGSGGALKGTYDFVGFTLISNSSSKVEMEGETIEISFKTHYITKDNRGTAVFDGSTLKTSDFAYTVDTSIVTETIINGESDGGTEVPFYVEMPASSSTGQYELKGADSVLFKSGLVKSPVYGGGETASLPSAAKYTWKGDTLILTQSLNLSSVANGMQTVHTGTTVTKLKKRS